MCETLLEPNKAHFLPRGIPLVAVFNLCRCDFWELQFKAPIGDALLISSWGLDAETPEEKSCGALLRCFTITVHIWSGETAYTLIRYFPLSDTHYLAIFTSFQGFSGGSDGKESACNAGDLGSIPGLGRSPGEGIGYTLQYSGLENSMD